DTHAVRVVRDRCVDAAAVAHLPGDQGQIELVDSAPAKLRAQVAPGGGATGGEQDARGRGVEPMDQTGFEERAADSVHLWIVAEQVVGDRTAIIGAACDGGHAGRLVDRDQRRIGIENRYGEVWLRHQPALPEGGVRTYDVAASECLAFTTTAAVHRYRAGRDGVASLTA